MLNGERRDQEWLSVLLIFESLRWQTFSANRWTTSKLDLARHHTNHSLSIPGSQRRGGARGGVDHLSIRTCTFSFNFLLRSPEGKWQKNIEIIGRWFCFRAAESVVPLLPEVIFPKIEFVSDLGESCCFIQGKPPGKKMQYFTSVNVLAPYFDSSKSIFCFVLRRVHANGLSQRRHQQAPVAHFVFHSEAQPEQEKNDLSDLLSEV